MNSWILALIAIVVGTVVGMIASRLVHSIVGADHRPEAIRNVARPVSQLALAAGVVVGLMTALGFVQPDALERLPRDFVALIPKLMVATIIIILANVLASFATTALNQVTGRMPLNVQRQANLVVKGTIVTLAVLLAVGQIGIDTEIINAAVRAVFFALAASFTLLVGLGGHGVAREVAASRALRRTISTGDRVTIEGITGTIEAIHPTSIELSTADGQAVMVPSSNFLSNNLVVERGAQSPAESAVGDNASEDLRSG